MIAFPNAKINIGLNILRKRGDGYHDIETVMVPLKGICFDALEIVRGRKSGVWSSGLKIEGNAKNNLCVKAYEMLKKDFHLPPVKIHLHKAIPMGAGLGGGSADGAFLLKLLNEEFKLSLSEKKLETYAARLGSDCPFFIRNEPAFAEGRGELLTPADLTRSLQGKYLVIVYPDVHVNTAEAYKAIDRANHRSQIKKHKLHTAITLPINKWKDRIVNDFEEPAFKKHPVLKKIKSKLYSAGALYASMSGSGSAVYGIYANKTDLKNKFPDCLVMAGVITSARFSA